MSERERKSKIDENSQRFTQEYSEFFQIRERIKPWWGAFKIMSFYLLLGGLWILLSDRILDIVVESEELFKQIQLYKGWFYVFVTGVIFYIIIRKTLMLYKAAVDRVLDGYEDLSAAYEEMLALNAELDATNDTLRRQGEELLISKQRYELAAEGSDEGIWDWDIINGGYFCSERWKRQMGYEPEDIEPNIEAWKKLFNPVDLDRTMQALEDYLVKNSGNFQAVYRLKKKSGEWRFISSTGKAVWDEDGNAIRMAGSHMDITERRNLEEKLETLAYYDRLTGLPNRAYLEKEAKVLLPRLNKLAFILLDIDDFKHINDTFGREVGDTFIQHMADVFSNCMGQKDILARISGGQFAFLMTGINHVSEVVARICLILDSVRIPWCSNGQTLYATASVGFALYPEHDTDFQALMQKAEMAMFCQKERGKDGYVIFEPVMYERILKFTRMNHQLRMAIENKEFLLYYQPQFDLETGKILALEALIRWQHPEQGFIPPMEFIPFAEKTKHIIPITMFVIETAINQRREWIKKGFAPVKIAINLSGHVIMEEDVMEKIYNLFLSKNVKEGEIEIEVTETALMLELNRAEEVLRHLKELGLSIAMDDFGTGYSSLTYLHVLPFDVLKIDREFIKNVKTEDEDSFIYKTVVDLAHNLKLQVVAEGIETKEQKEFLLKNNCDMGQGFYFAKPLPPEEIEKYLEKL